MSKRYPNVFLFCAAALAASVCFLGAVAAGDVKPSAPGQKGVASGKYKESPEVAKLVAAGKLPPLEERLPKDVQVVQVPEIGTYGGEYRAGGFGPTHGLLDSEAPRYLSLLTIDKDFLTLTPHLLKDYKANNDFTEYTFYLREGQKWSNGDPLTTADFMFWYEDILCNPDVFPGIPERWKTNGELMKFVPVSDYELKVVFTAPYPSFEIAMARANSDDDRRNFLAPKEYLKKYHIKYNPGADALAKEEGFASWSMCLQAHLCNNQKQTDVNSPDVTPWVLSEVTSEGNKIYRRNPYYHVVDQEGNQLPYMDQQVSVLTQDNQVRTMKLINGELDAAGQNPLPVADYTLYKENEKKGDYTTYLFENTRGSDAAMMFNLTHKDPVMRKVFNELKFREAMSYAIDREEINSTLFFGRATIRMGTVPPNVSFLDPKWEKYMTEFDPDRANEMLDELGYKWNGDETVRLMPDGREFNLILEVTEEFAPQSEMIAEYWTNVGVRTQMRLQERAYYRERGKSNDRDVICFGVANVTEFGLRSSAFSILAPGGQQDDTTFMQEYKLWFTTGGKSGEEPPEDIKNIYAKCQEFGTLAASDPRYKTLGKEILDEINSRLWFIGTSVAPRVIIINNRIGNTPDGGIFAEDYNFWKPYRGDTWFVKYEK